MEKKFHKIQQGRVVREMLWCFKLAQFLAAADEYSMKTRGLDVGVMIWAQNKTKNAYLTNILTSTAVVTMFMF